MISPAISSLLDAASAASERDDHVDAASALRDAHLLFRAMRDDQRLIPPDRGETLDAIYATAKALVALLRPGPRRARCCHTRAPGAPRRATPYRLASARRRVRLARSSGRRGRAVARAAPLGSNRRGGSSAVARHRGNGEWAPPPRYLASGDGPFEWRSELGEIDDRRAARVVLELADEWRCDGEPSRYAFALGIAHELYARPGDDENADDIAIAPAASPAPAPIDEAGELDLEVRAIGELLSARAFDQLRWHIDRNGFGVSAAQLVADVFLRSSPGEPELLARWWPFPPGSRRVKHLRVGDVALVEVVQEIPQGDGMVMRLLAWAWFRWSTSGWRA